MNIEIPMQMTLVEALMEANWIKIKDRELAHVGTVYMFKLPDSTYVVMLIDDDGSVDYSSCYINCLTAEQAQREFNSYFPTEAQRLMSIHANSSNNSF